MLSLEQKDKRYTEERGYLRTGLQGGLAKEVHIWGFGNVIHRNHFRRGKRIKKGSELWDLPLSLSPLYIKFMLNII